MLDPASLGTLRIGLDSVRLENEYDRPRRRAVAAHRPTNTVRRAMAGALRRAAAALERPTMREAAR